MEFFSNQKLSKPKIQGLRLTRPKSIWRFLCSIRKNRGSVPYIWFLTLHGLSKWLNSWKVRAKNNRLMSTAKSTGSPWLCSQNLVWTCKTTNACSFFRTFECVFRSLRDRRRSRSHWFLWVVRISWGILENRAFRPRWLFLRDEFCGARPWCVFSLGIRFWGLFCFQVILWTCCCQWLIKSGVWSFSCKC